MSKNNTLQFCFGNKFYGEAKNIFLFFKEKYQARDYLTDLSCQKRFMNTILILTEVGSQKRFMNAILILTEVGSQKRFMNAILILTLFRPFIIVTILVRLFLKISATFCLFSSFSQYNDEYSSNFNYKSVDGLLEIWTRDHSIVGAYESTELWRPPS